MRGGDMEKEEFKRFRGLPEEREYLIKRIETLEKRAEKIQTVKDLVQSSQKEFPYIEKSVSVDAPEPIAYTKNRRELIRRKRRLLYVEKLLDELVHILERIDDSRTRQILTYRYVEGMKLKDVAIKFSLTEQGVLKIINGGIKNL